MTTRLVDRDWDVELVEGRRIHGAALRIICPFIKTRPITDLLRGMRPQPLYVLTRFNLADFGSGVSDIAALRAVLNSGGSVRGVRGLHSKVFLFDDARAAVTSANLTTRGLTQNHEFGVVSEEPAFVGACRSYFDQLWDAAAGTDLTAADLDVWEAQVTAFLASGGQPFRQAGLPDHGVVVVGADPAIAPVTEGWPAESARAFVKFFGEGDNRVQWTLDAFEGIQRSGCHWACTYPRGKRPRQVKDGDTLFTARLVRDPNDTLIFGRVIGMEHVEVRDDATADEITIRPWKTQWPHYVRVHHGKFVAGPLANGVPLSEIMDTLRANAFASTQQNSRRRSGNTNPRAAIRQQAAVRLTREGAALVSARLEHAFSIHGSIPAEQLAPLDWPRLDPGSLVAPAGG